LIAKFLFTVVDKLSPDQPEPYIQAVSAIIDIYSDENVPYDVNFRQSGRLADLKALLLPFRSLVRSIDRRNPGGRELRQRGDEILINLRAFIQYREILEQQS
jgi:hypothetical protein